MDVIHEDIVYIVLEDSGFVDGLDQTWASVPCTLDHGDSTALDCGQWIVKGRTYREESSSKDIQQTRFPTCAVAE